MAKVGVETRSLTHCEFPRSAQDRIVSWIV